MKMIAVPGAILVALVALTQPAAAAGNPNIVAELKQGKTLGDRTYKVHLDGYNQMDMLTGKAPSNREEIFYFAETNLGAVRIGNFKYIFIEQPDGWPAQKVRVNMPKIVNIRQDPFERTPQTDWGVGSSDYMMGFYAIEFPPMQNAASFNLQAVKTQIEAAIAANHGK